MKNLLKFKIIILAIIFFNSAPSVFAAEIFFEPDNQQIKTGNEFKVNLFINTQEEKINAIEGSIIFPDSLLKLKEIRDGNSVINFWNERPEISDNNILFSGIIPGGYLGREGLILSAIFEPLEDGTDFIKITNAKILLNDGKGTEVNASTSNLRFIVSQNNPVFESNVDAKEDSDIPEDFKILISKDPAIFNGEYFLVFATQDKGSGINYYEVCEGKRPCVKAESPYLLQNQSLNEDIVVKAVDNSGNERVARLELSYKEYLIYVNIIIAFIMICVIYKFLWKKHKK